jgi:5-methyltetrahydrofolate--homocysteine methyltransferase
MDLFNSYKNEPDINRLLDAFKHRRIDRVPNFEVLIEDKHVEQVLGRYAGNTLAIGGDPAKGVEESKEARPMHAKDYLELCRIIGQDAMIVEAIWTPFKKKNDDGTLSLAADRSIKSRRDFEECILPPSEDDIEERMQYVREYRRVIDQSGTKIGFCVLVAAYFQTLYEFLIGMEDCMTLVYRDRDFIEELLEISTEYWVRFVERSVEEGVDFIWAADDVAFKTGLFLPPAFMKELWLPHLQRIIAPALNAGKPVMFHSDGKIDDIVPWLADIGVDCIQPMDPYGIDFREYKKRFGNIVCLAGNIDIEFPLAHGTIEDVERDVKEHMEVLKPGGGYVATSSHSIVNYIPYENFVAMINAIHRYGLYEGGQWSFQGEKPRATEKGEPAVAEKFRGETRPAGSGEGRPAVLQDIHDALYGGEQERIGSLVQKALADNHTAVNIIDDALTPAIQEVGERFSSGELFLPDLLLAANTMQEAMKILTPLMEERDRKMSRGRVVIGTIKGDLHDIGKNMVGALLKGNGFEVIDIGIDNGPEAFVKAVEENEPDVVGYSGLLTTTLGGMPEQIEALQKAGLREKVLTIVGGAPVTQEFAERNGIDLYGGDANQAVKVIEKALSERRNSKRW